MRKLIQLLGVVAIIWSIGACGNGGNGVPTISGDVQLNTLEDTIAYGMGVVAMSSIKDQFKIEEPNFGIINRAMQDVHSGTPLITQEEFNQVANNFFRIQQEEKGKEALQKGRDFLANNAQKEGVKMTDSGLQYKVLQEGTGASPKLEDKVTVHYHGTLLDGTVFDSSVDRGQPASFPVSGVIPGWTEALQMMKVGDKWQVYIPSELAYGPRGAGGQIGPNEALIFDVELIEIAE